MNLSTGGASRGESGHPTEAFHLDSSTMLALLGGGFISIIEIFFVCLLCFILLIVLFCFSLLFCPDIFLYSPPVDIDQLKLILRLVGTPGAELLKKISSESVS